MLPTKGTPPNGIDDLVTVAEPLQLFVVGIGPTPPLVVVPLEAHGFRGHSASRSRRVTAGEGLCPGHGGC